MPVSSDITTDPIKIGDSLYVHDKKEYPFIVNRVSDICLTKFVEMTFRNELGDPLRLLPFQSVMLHMMWHKKFPMILACRGAGKTFMLAIFCLLKCLLVPGTKVVIVSGGFRQAKFTFQYIDTLIYLHGTASRALAWRVFQPVHLRSDSFTHKLTHKGRGGAGVSASMV